LETISCVATLFNVATIATPHASCSFAGSYNPVAFGIAEKALAEIKIGWPLA
jgi:hypothetical protein